MEMNQLVVRGKSKVCGIEVPNIYGGFGENQKVILAKTVAELHDRPLKKINELINNHLIDGYFEEGIDFIDLKNGLSEVPLKDLGFSNRDIKISNNIYLLSQQGYTLLLKLMNSDLARKQYKEVIREYFTIKESIKYLTPSELQRLVAREIGIVRRNRETQTISKFISKGEFKNIKCNPYAMVTNTTYDVLYGMYKKDIIKYLDLKQQDNLRDFLSKKDLEEIREIEDFIHFMGDIGKKWNEIYKELLRLYPDKITPTKEDKSIKELKKCDNKVYLESAN